MSVLPVIEEEYVASGDVKIEVRPIAIVGDTSDHDNESVRAAAAVQCANDQGKFWEYHDILYANWAGENEGAFSDANLKRFAAAIDLDTAAFNSCLDSDKYDSKVRSDTNDAKAAGARSTPTIFVNGTKVEATVENLKAAIEAALSGS